MYGGNQPGKITPTDVIYMENAEAIEGVKSVNLKLTFDPPWDETMLTEEAKLELGLL